MASCAGSTCTTHGYREFPTSPVADTNSYPPQRIGADDDVQTTWDALRAISNEEAPSRLWDAGVRSKLRSPAFSKSDLDMRRHHLALPGSRLHALAKDDRIPVMLVKRTVPSGMQGEEAAAFHGYTLLFPRGWSMAFLPSFVYCNVRLGGIAERCVQYREAGTPSFPEHYGSVCLAGASWEEEQAVNAERRWLRKPPGKRPEYSLLGTKWPFRPDWNVVLSVSVMVFHELNGQDAPDSGPADSAQAQMQPWLVNPALSSYIAAMDKEGLDVVDYLLRAVNAFRRRRSLEALPSRVAAELLSTAVCHVQVNMIGRGSPSDMAILYAVGGDERASWLQAFQVDSAGLDFGSDGGEMLKVSAHRGCADSLAWRGAQRQQRDRICEYWQHLPDSWMRPCSSYCLAQGVSGLAGCSKWRC